MKPAIFNTEMVRAILDDRKTQTRRVVNNVPKSFNFQRCGIDRTHGSKTFGKFVAIFDDGNFSEFIASPYKVGDIIYVRETWNHTANESDLLDHESRNKIGGRFIVYRADGEQIHPIHGKSIWKPSTHMPKEYARLFLRVKDVRIERLNEISKKDACDEGIDWINVDLWRTIKTCFKDYIVGNYPFMYDPISSFKTLWESIYGNGSFDNRYVWVIEFERISEEEAYREQK